MVPYCPSVSPPDPCPVTVMVPCELVLVAVAVPVGLLLDAVLHAVGVPIPGAEPVAPPHGGGAVLPVATVNDNVAEAAPGG